MKIRRLVVCFCFLISSFQARAALQDLFLSTEPSRAYLGVEGGLAKVQDGNPIFSTIQAVLAADGDSASTTAIDREWGWGGRLFTGWRYNRFLGLEFGYSRFENKKISFSADGTTMNYRLKTEALDVLAQISMPLGQSGWQAYLKGGGAYISPKAKLGVISVDEEDPEESVNLTLAINTPKWRPAIGLGAIYMINANAGVNFFWQRYFGNKSSAIDLENVEALLSGNVLKAPKIDFVGIGLRVFLDNPFCKAAKIVEK